MNSVKNLKMIVGTAKTSHMLLLFTSVVLISIGIYGTVVSKKYGCDNGISIKLHNLEDVEDIFQNSKTKKYDTPIDKCITDSFGGEKLNINKFDRCLNDYGKGHLRCMEGGLMGLSITSIVIGVLMLLLSGYLLFM